MNAGEGCRQQAGGVQIKRIGIGLTSEPVRGSVRVWIGTGSVSGSDQWIVYMGYKPIFLSFVQSHLSLLSNLSRFSLSLI
jgi:hypothetical protein